MPVRSVIEVGANEGQSAKLITRFRANAHLYAFEPLPGPNAKLKRWAETQGERVTSSIVALGDMCNDADIFLQVEHTYSSSFLASTPINKAPYHQTRVQRPVRVHQGTLDQLPAVERGVKLDRTCW
jgi:FkbM family methyltransferase